jgi:transposase-like protein
VIAAKAADESTIRLLLADRQQESLTVYTDSFRAYEPLEADDAFNREYVVHGDGEYADDEVYVNTCESHASRVRRWLSPHRGISKDKLIQYLRAFQLRRKLYRKSGHDAFKHAVRATL